MNEIAETETPIVEFFGTDIAQKIVSARRAVAGKTYDAHSYRCVDFAHDLLTALRKIISPDEFSLAIVATGVGLPEHITDMGRKSVVGNVQYDGGHAMVLVTTPDNTRGILMEPQQSVSNWTVEDPLGPSPHMDEIIIGHLRRNIDYPPEFPFDDVKFGAFFPLEVNDRSDAK